MDTLNSLIMKYWFVEVVVLDLQKVFLQQQWLWPLSVGPVSLPLCLLSPGFFQIISHLLGSVKKSQNFFKKASPS